MDSNSGDPRVLYARSLRLNIGDHGFYVHLIFRFAQYKIYPYSLRLFTQFQFPTVFSWTALISSNSNTLTALCQFISMHRFPTRPNQSTFATLFKTCASLSSLPFGLSLHSLSVKLALASEPYSGSSLIHFYSKLGRPVCAWKVLDEIPDKDVVCYGAAIVGLAQNSRPSDALSVFADMKCRDVESNAHTVSGR